MNKYFRFWGGVALIGLLIGILFNILPIQGQFTKLPLFASTLLAIVLMGWVWNLATPFGKKAIMGGVTLLFVGTFFSFFVPETTKALAEAGPRIDQAIAGTIRNPKLPSFGDGSGPRKPYKVVEVELLGEDQWTEPLNLNIEGAIGDRWDAAGPPNTYMMDQDGRTMNIAEEVGESVRSVRFQGVEGEKVLLKFYKRK